MSSFNQCSSVEKLSELQRNPLDLTHDGILTPKRLDEMTAKACGLSFFYGTERVSNKVMEALFELADEAKVHEKMQAMQNGEVINRIEGHESENRMVLHTSMRDFFDAQNESENAKNAAEQAYAELEKLKKFLANIEKHEFTDLIQIGIGGSDLGPRAIYMALKAFKKPNRRVHYISNVDPDDAFNVLEGLDLKKTLVVVVSKSGNTLETLTNEALVKERFEKEGLSPKDHFIAVTGKGSPMDNPELYQESFYIWDFIGGRYSVTSMVGCVSLAFALGMEKLLEFLRGASTMDKAALSEDKKNNLPLISALLGIWNRNFLNLPTKAVIPYSQAMIRFSAHLQQLDMESNGKSIDKEGVLLDYETSPVIWGEPGTNGQHSFYQCIHQGTSTIPIEFIGFLETQYGSDALIQGSTSQEKLLSNLFAQSLSLAMGKSDDNPNKNFPGNRPNSILFAKKCDPFTLGAILSYYEHKVAFQGFIWNINSFDQEGVQLGKVLANKIIKMFAYKREDKDIDMKEFPLGLHYLKKLDDI